VELKWHQVRLDERLSPQQEVPGVIRLETGTARNGSGREFPCAEALRAVLLKQYAERKRLQKEDVLCPNALHRNGKPISSFYKVWRTACRQAGCAGKIPHDFRRTATRNLVRAGVPEQTSMRLTGHKTRSVFERYDIQTGSDLANAVALLSAASRGKAAGTR
jgi:integrase